MGDHVEKDLDRRNAATRRVYIVDITQSNKSRSNSTGFENFNEVKIFGTVVSKRIYRSEGKVEYGVLSVDDGSGSTIQIKAWGNTTATIDRFQQGELVDVVGKLKQSKNEIYVVPEIIRRLDDPNWEIVRELEIIEGYLRRSKARIRGADLPDRQTVNLKSEIVGIVDGEGGSTGIDYTELVKCIKHSNEEEIKKTLNELLDQGIICETRPGRYRK
jgi:RPA family protein